MSKTKISEFSTTPGNNTDINGINIAEGCAPSGINNAIRELMSDLKEWQSGAMDVYVIPQGTVAAPGIQLYGDLDTGLYGFAANQLGVAVGGASAGYFSSDGWVGNVVATTVDLTNIEVTNIKAKDGTAAITIADSTGVVSVSTQLAVDNLNLSGNTLSSSDTNGNIILAPNGTGDVYLDADTIRVGDSNTNVTITSNGTADLILNTNSGTNSGSITIQDGVNGNILIATNGTGQIQLTGDLDVANVETGAIKARDGTAAISIADSTGAVSVSTQLNVDNLRLDGNTLSSTDTSGNIIIAPDGSGQVHISNTVPAGLYQEIASNSRTPGISSLQVGQGASGEAYVVNRANSDLIFGANGIQRARISANGGFRIKGAGTAGTSDAVVINQSAPTDSFVINASGQVGIGTSTLLSTLTVSAAGASQTLISTTGTNGASSGFSNTGGTVGVGINSSAATPAYAAYISHSGTYPISFYTDSVERARINSDGILSGWSGTNSAPTFSYTNDPNTGIFFPAADKLGFTAGGGSDQMVLTTTGLGIGTSSPTNALSVTGNANITGNTTLGDASTDTVTVNGYMGIGGAGSAAAAIRIDSNALSGTSQDSILAYHTGTSGATANIRGVVTSVNTAVAAYTVTNVAGFWAANAGKGSGSTITNQHGLYIADQTQGTNNYGITSLVSSGTNKWNIYVSGTAANYFAGNVGIGTSSPAKQLDLAASNTGITTGDPLNTLRFTDTDTTSAAGQPIGRIEWYSADADTAGVKAYIQAQSTDGSPDADMVFATNHVSGGGTAERMRIQYDGNVGIGTSSPVSVLDVAGTTPVLTIKDTQSKTWAPNDTVGDLDFYSTDPSGTGPRTVARVRSVADANATTVAGALSFWTSAADSAATEKVRITSAGNVGIGTNSPGAKLDVNGSINIASTQNLQWGSSALAIAGASNILTFYTSSSERLRIDSSGALIAKPAAGTGAVFNEDGVDADFRVESDTNTHALFVEGTNSNVKIGGSAERATTVGTNHLDIFNGTAPVGTLTNGISLYSSSGEAYVMDAAGNATLFSPHDRETNEWIFKSKHTPTGKVLKIDVERLLKFVNDHFGLDAVHEFIED
jgi:hypothetical protein